MTEGAKAQGAADRHEVQRAQGASEGAQAEHREGARAVPEAAET